MKLNINIIFLLSFFMIAFSCDKAVALTKDELDEYREAVRAIGKKIEENVPVIDVSSKLPEISDDKNLTIMLGDIYDDLAQYYSYRFYKLKEKEAETLLDRYIALKNRNAYSVPL